MNRKLISFVFSALICSTLGHEYLRANQLSKQHERFDRKAPHVGIHQNRGGDDGCVCHCPEPKPSKPDTNIDSFPIDLIRGSHILGLVNNSADVAIGFHLEESLVIVINGKTGVTVLLDIAKEVGIYFQAGSNDNLWLSSKITFEEYILKLSVLTTVRNWANGQNFKLGSPPKQVTTAVVSIIIHLCYEITKRVEKNPDAVISILVVLTKTLVKSINIVTLVLSKLGNTLNVVIQGGLVKLVGTIQGLQLLEENIPGILTTLTRNLNVALLLTYSSGLGFVLNILSQNSKSVDVSKALGNRLQSPEDLLGLAVLLDYGSYIGIAGITAVIYNVQLYTTNKISLEDLIDIVIQVEASNVEKIDKKTWDDLISLYSSIIQDQTSTFNNGQYWSVHTKFVQDIKSDKLVISGINVSAIINTLIKTSGSSSLTRLLRILLELKVLVSVTTIVSTLYLRLIWFVISGQGIIFITQILPDISINIDFSSTNSIIKQILANVNIKSLFRYIVTLDVVGVITHLPVFGIIFQSLNSAFKAVGVASQVSLAQALKETSFVIKLIKNWIWYGLGQTGGSQPPGGRIAGLSPVGGGVAVSSTSTWKTTTWTSLSWSSRSSRSVVTGSGSAGSGSSSSGGSSVTVNLGGSGTGGITGGGRSTISSSFVSSDSGGGESSGGSE